MKREPVQSSRIRSIGHDPVTQRMEVEFNDGKVYTYHGVSARKHKELMEAKSIGRHFGENFTRHPVTPHQGEPPRPSSE
jgi:hypothetical protein